jgi:hypothetical protein
MAQPDGYPTLQGRNDSSWRKLNSKSVTQFNCQGVAMPPRSHLFTCHRRFKQWVRSGVVKGILEALALDLKLRGPIDVREAFIDASFAPAKKGA